MIILLQCGLDLNGHCYCWFVDFLQSAPEHVSGKIQVKNIRGEIAIFGVKAKIF